jgi:transcription-repair coupling factor (superfamily II helicase)
LQPIEDRSLVVPEVGRGPNLTSVVDLIEARERTDVLGARGGSLAALLARVAQRRSKPIVLLVEDPRTAAAAARDLSFFTAERASSGADQVLLFPHYEFGPYDDLFPQRMAAVQRTGALFRLALGIDWRILVLTADALFRRVAPREVFEEGCAPVAVGERIDRDGLVRLLERGGYNRAPLVEEHGTYAVRGGLLDVFPPYLTSPVRVELFGSEVESIRSFDPETQSGLESIEEFWIHPARPYLPPSSAPERTAAAERIRRICDAVDQPTSRTERLIEDVQQGRLFAGIDGMIPALVSPLGKLADYLPEDVLVCVDDPAAVSAAWHKQRAALEADRARRLERREPAFPVTDHVVDPDELEADLLARRLVISHRLDVVGEHETPLTRCVEPVELSAAETRGLGEHLRRTVPAGTALDLARPLVTHLADLVDRGYRTVIAAHTRGQTERLAAVLRGRDLEAKVLPAGEQLESPGVAVTTGELARGCVLPGDAICLIAEEEIFGRRSRRRRGPRRARDSLKDLRNLAPGDLVVHVEHGIGRYEGLVRQRVGSGEVDFLLILYRGGDKLYLPVYRLNQVQKYRGAGEGETQLDKLGGQTFSHTMARVREEAAQLAARLLDLYARRSAANRPPVGELDDLYRSVEASFPFEETDDQLRAIDEVMVDLDGRKPMDRLICGDVGFGKTEVAIRAAFRVVMSGRQVAVLVPTTVLAQQHYQSFAARFAPYPIRVEMLSRFRSSSANAAVALGLKDGTVDVVVGTHRLLSRDVHFKRLGLLVIDEEHRFGVKHKERVRELMTAVDTMVLTATPIPRTLQMAYSGLRDLSLITTAPEDRRPIRTVVCHDEPGLLGQAMERELAREGQVFFVHNRVRGIEKVAERVRKLVPRARVAVGHGQMKEEDLEQVMLDFVAGRYDILVCTSIIESGLDIPRANTIIVDRADTFGLAQLYQLRGRVGRSHVQAYAYLVVPPLAGLSEEARDRVEAMVRHTDLGSGFSVATLDMEMRGAGNLLGAEQSGSVSAVGFELFCELLAEASSELRGEDYRVEVEPEVTLDQPGFLPEEYIPDVGQRLSLYKRLASCGDEGEVERLAAEMVDRFGPLPTEAEEVIGGMAVKALCRALRIPGLEANRKQLTIHLGSDSLVDPDVVRGLVSEARGRVRLTGDLKIVTRFSGDAPSGTDGAIRFLRRLGSYDNNPPIS